MSEILTVPEVRDRLYQLADELGSTELRRLADNLWRRRPGRQTRAQSRAVTPELVTAIREFAADHPSMTEHQIGVRFGVNQGRVSEALFGFRK